MTETMAAGMLVTLVVMLALAGLLLFNTVRSPSRRMEVVPPEGLQTDTAAPAGRLAAAIRFPTVAADIPEEMDFKPFKGLHAFLEAARHQQDRPAIGIRPRRRSAKPSRVG